MTGTLGMNMTRLEPSVQQHYPEDELGTAAAPRAEVNGQARIGWQQVGESRAFWTWVAKNKNVGNLGMSTKDIEAAYGFANSSEPVQASPGGNVFVAAVSALPKLLWQTIYVNAMDATTCTKLHYSRDGPMWIIFAILSHALDQMMVTHATESSADDSSMTAAADASDGALMTSAKLSRPRVACDDALMPL